MSGVLAATFTAAMKIWDAQKAQGVGVPDRILALGIALRSSWPGQTREWKYLCRHCDDYGLVMAECEGDAACGRDKRHLPHSFGTPCWCSNGNRYKRKDKPAPEDFAAAGRVKQPARIGR
jgi:hypothetical protein